MLEPLVSIIVPARNEEGNVGRLEEELTAAIDGLPYRFEVVVVDNASTDRTGDLVKEICRRDPRWRYVRFSRDFGPDASMTAGHRYARGDAMIVLYSDLQEPPDAIPAFLAKWREGFDVVNGIQAAREGESRLRSVASRLAYRLISACSDVEIPRDSADYRLITREVRDALMQFGERSRYLRGLISWLGFRQATVTYVRRPRHAGSSNMTPGRLVRFLLDAIVAFSLRPLQLLALLAAGLLTGALAVSVGAAVGALGGDGVSGNALLAILVLVVGGLNALGLWIVAEYVGRIGLEVRGRPLFVVAETYNLEPGPKESPAAGEQVPARAL